MTRLLRIFPSGSVASAALTLIFFLLYYLCLWLVVDLRLIYHGAGMILNFPVFYIDEEFFRQTVFWPGGLVAYVSAFLSQFFRIGWAGALIVTAQAWLLWLFMGIIFNISGGRKLRLICFAAPVLMLLLYCRYIYQFNVITGILASLGFACLYLIMPAKGRLLSFLIFLALSVILYAIAGGAWILFVAVCAVSEVFSKHQPILGVIFLLSAPIAAYIVSSTVFEIGLTTIVDNYIPRYQKGDISNAARLTAVYGLYLLTPLTLVCLWLMELLQKRIGRIVFHGRKVPVALSPDDAENLNQSLISRLAGTIAQLHAPLLAVTACVLVGLFYHNSVLKTRIAVNYYSCGSMWPQILEASSRYPADKFISHAANRALFRTGLLTQEMFSYGQQPDALMLSGESANPLGMWRLFDTYLDLGQINLSRYMCAMLMDIYGEQPIILKRLAFVTMVRGDAAAAKVYLEALSRTLFDAGWARQWLEKIETDPNLSTVEDIQRLRSLMPATDRDFKSLNENIFTDLLDANKHNRMAFEYLESYYLLTNQLDKFVAKLGCLNDFDYDGIPRVYEEAILIYSYNTKKKVELPGREISKKSVERFGGFNLVLKGRYKSNKMAAFKELKKDYGDSYFFYFIYGPAGVTQ